jgi:hypothetical protein
VVAGVAKLVAGLPLLMAVEEVLEDPAYLVEVVVAASALSEVA